ncbi:GNAT family N-acetyltransferase [Reichenbachiella sp.]|uniref:GNAT family N-acetyltransferase n=1 Tax=Reichenbachiella sp. TaxID=2184521 RepID=UPI003BAFE8AC
MIDPSQRILFDDQIYLDANSIQKTFVYEWKESECKINITFSQEDHLAISLPKAPYAGFNIEGSLSQTAMDKMTTDLKEKLSKRGIQKAIVRQRPEFEPTPEFQIIHDGLVRHKFSYTKEANQFVFLGQDFEQNLHPMQLRKIKKCQQEQLIFSKEDPSKIQEVHSFLTSCRNQQGLEINIDNQSLKQLFLKLPRSYECYTVRNCEQKILAATILVLVNDQILYNYLPGFDRVYKSLSPLSYLLFQLYHDLRDRNYEIFDLGISSIDGELQNGLFTYKKRMGAEQSDRFIYEINLK